MSPGPSIITECHKCNGLFTQWTLRSGNTFDARFWPDGLMKAPMMPELPPLITCPCCDDFIWRKDCKEIEEIYGYDAIQAKYPGIKSYNNPNIDTFMLALQEKGLKKNREGYIRTKLMHFFNDENRDSEIPISEPSDMQIENYKRLLEIANKNDANDILLRAEIYRELGDFEKSLNLLESTINAMPDNYLESARHLILLCKNKDSRVMEILTREN